MAYRKSNNMPEGPSNKGSGTTALQYTVAILVLAMVVTMLSRTVIQANRTYFLGVSSMMDEAIPDDESKRRGNGVIVED